jgi:hypothetical protein
MRKMFFYLIKLKPRRTTPAVNKKLFTLTNKVNSFRRMILK